MNSEQITVIEPKTGWRAVDWKELVRYRDLFYYFVLRDITVLYKQTVMGFAWAIIRPVLSTVIFTLVFGGMAGLPADGIDHTVFYFSGLVPWFYFSTAMSRSTESLVAGKDMLTKIYFPRLIVPFTPILAGLVDFFVSFAVLVIVVYARGLTLSPQIVFLPLVMAVIMLTAAGIGLWLSALNIQYRDVKHANQFMIQIMQYAAPVVWPLSLLTEKLAHKFPAYHTLLHYIYGLYPMGGAIDAFRSCLLGKTPMPWDLLGVGGLSAAVLFITGVFYFRRTERVFADVA